MRSHDSIYELLGTNMKESKRYSFSLTAQFTEKKYSWIPWASKENKQVFIRKSTSRQVLMWQFEADVREELR